VKWPATKRERLACPEAGDDLQPLIEQLRPAARVTLLAEMGEARVRDDVIVHVTEADAENCPALGELIDGSDLARDVPRPSARERSHLDTEYEPACANGDRCEHRPGRTRGHLPLTAA
jgi:hypothetical protein